jgi:hypothetical protein
LSESFQWSDASLVRLPKDKISSAIAPPFKDDAEFFKQIFFALTIIEKWQRMDPFIIRGLNGKNPIGQMFFDVFPEDTENLDPNDFCVERGEGQEDLFCVDRWQSKKEIFDLVGRNEEDEKNEITRSRNRKAAEDGEEGEDEEEDYFVKTAMDLWQLKELGFFQELGSFQYCGFSSGASFVYGVTKSELYISFYVGD